MSRQWTAGGPSRREARRAADELMQGMVRSHQVNQPEAPSPSPAPQPSVVYAEPIENHNNREIIQLKEKINCLLKFTNLF